MRPLLLLFAAVLASAQEKKIDPAYITAVQAISNQLQQSLRAMQQQATDAVNKIAQAQCKEGHIKPESCQIDWQKGVYFYSKPAPPPGTASPK